MTPSEGQRTVRAAMHVVAETLTAHGFAAHAEDRGEKTAVVAEQCPFGDASTHQPGAVRGRPRHGQGPARRSCAARRRNRRSRSSCRRGPGATTPAPPLPEPARGSRLPRSRQHDAGAARSPRRTRPVGDAPTGDPGRLHEEGRIVARRARARRATQVAGLLGAAPRQVVFTSGATEAINAAVWGADPCRTRARPCSAPPSSTRPCGTPPTRLAPTESTAGRRHGADRRRCPAANACGAGDLPRPALVHCQWANHEVGTLQPVHQVVELCRDGRRDRARRRGGGLWPRADGPRRARRRPGERQRPQVRWRPRGGRAGRAAGQPVRTAHRRRRAGARPPRRARAHPGAPGLRRRSGGAGGGRAAGHGERGRRPPGGRSPPSSTRHWRSTASRWSGRPSPEDRLPHLVCLGVHGVEAEPVLIGLDRAGVAVHSGSACSSESIEPSPVLEAMGVDPSHSLRVSVGWTTDGRRLRCIRRRVRPRRRRIAGPTGLTTRRRRRPVRAAPRRGRHGLARRVVGAVDAAAPPAAARPPAGRRPGSRRTARRRRRCCGPGWPGSSPRRDAPRSRSARRWTARLDLGAAVLRLAPPRARTIPTFHISHPASANAAGLDGSSDSTLL